MVKLYSLSVLFKGPNSAVCLKSAYDLSAFGYFQRGSVQEFMGFVSKTIVERTQIAARQSVKEGGMLVKRTYVHTNIMFTCIYTFSCSSRIYVSCLCTSRQLSRSSNI